MNKDIIWEDFNIKYIHDLNSGIPKKLKTTIIGRYFSFSGFLDFIQSSELQFKKISTFEDKYEGFSQHYGLFLSLKRSEKVREKDYLQERLRFLKYQIDTYYASCWVINKIESYSMWKIYSSLNEGILLLTTVNDLVSNISARSFEISNRHIQRYFCGEVDYGYKRNRNSDHLAAFGKPNFFKEENEFRVVFYQHPVIDHNIHRTKIDLKRAIRKIITAPYATDSFKTELKQILKSYKINANLLHDSEILNTRNKVFNNFYKQFIDH